MKRVLTMLLATLLTMLLMSACAGSDNAAESDTQSTTDSAQAVTPAETTPGADPTATAEPDEQKEEEEPMMQMTINETPVTVDWEKNDSVAALKELARDGLSIQMSMYGGFEQVGPIGKRLPSRDAQTVTDSGDIVLYSSSQLVVFYGSNSWAYTRLGHITDKMPEEMRDLLGSSDVTITLSIQ